MRFSLDFLDEIRARVPISAIVGTRVTFDRKKSNVSRGDFWACCPFHGEKTPSFHCDDRRGRYHCFGCGVSGDHFRFLVELDGLGFKEAVERLADMAGVPMPQQTPQDREREAVRASLYDVLEMAAQFFEHRLQEEGGAARQYLRGREFGPDMQKIFRLGYAADSRNRLKEFLVGKGVGKEQLEASGLLVSGEDIPVPYDRFRDRVMFPIEDLRGRVVGFGGRALAADARAKYLNSPETELFHKGRMLYNAARARRACQAQGGEGPKPVIVTEGYMDVIALAKAGFAQAVAPLGTALTEEQLALLWRFSPEPVLCFDGDGAGRKAAFRALERAMPLIKAGVSLQFVLLPDGKDPDDIIREGGADAFAQLLKQAVPLADMLWQKETDNAVFTTPESRAALERRLKEAAFTIKDESLRHYYLQDIRERMRAAFRPAFTPYTKGGGARRADFPDVMQQGRLQVSKGLNQSGMVKLGGTQIPLRGAAILAILVNHPELWHEYFEELAALTFENADLTGLHHAMLDILAEWHPEDGAAMRELLDKKGQMQIVERIMHRVGGVGLRSAQAAAPLEDAQEALKQALYLYHNEYFLNKRLREIEAELLRNPDGELFAMLRDIKTELEQTNATQALIEGFGQWEENP